MISYDPAYVNTHTPLFAEKQYFKLTMPSVVTKKGTNAGSFKFNYYVTSVAEIVPESSTSIQNRFWLWGVEDLIIKPP